MLIVFNCPSEPSRERFKLSRVIVECRVINHHPDFRHLFKLFLQIWLITF